MDGASFTAVSPSAAAPPAAPAAGPAGAPGPACGGAPRPPGGRRRPEGHAAAVAAAPGDPMAISGLLDRPLRSGDARALLAVGDHLELVAQMARGQAAAHSAGDAAGLEALIAALSRSGAALRGPPRAPSRAGCAAAARQQQALEVEAWESAAAAPAAPGAWRGGRPSEGNAGVGEACGQKDFRPPPQFIKGDDPVCPEDEEADEGGTTLNTHISSDGEADEGAIVSRRLSGSSNQAKDATAASEARADGNRVTDTGTVTSKKHTGDSNNKCDGRSTTSKPHTSSSFFSQYRIRSRSSDSHVSFFGEERGLARESIYKNRKLHAMELAVRSTWMECASTFLISLNVFFMVLEGQYTGARIGNEIGVYSHYGSEGLFAGVLSPDVFTAIDVVFCLLFTVELLLRFFFLRVDLLRDAWGWFDIATVLITDVTTFLYLVGKRKDSIPVNTIRAFRFARLLRILKLARTITAFDSLYLLTTALSSSMTTLMWVIVVLVLSQTLFALLLTYIVQDFYLTASGDGGEFFQTPLEKQEAYMYFGTFWRAMVSLFELMLANWPPICRLMMETMHEAWSVFVLAYKLVMGVAVIGVIMGVFTQETFRAAECDDHLMVKRKAAQTKTHNSKMEALFRKMANKDANAYVDSSLFKHVLGSPDMRMWLKAMDYDVSDAELIFYMIDKDGDGSLTVDELIEGMASLKGAARNIDVKLLMRQSRVGQIQQTQSSCNVGRMSAADALRIVEANPELT